MIARRRSQHRGEFLGGETAAGVELVYRREIVDGQVINILTRLCQGGEDAVQQTRFAVVLCNLFAHCRCPLPSLQSKT
jgi:hypothetical protein